jgi:NitT/TauT family transport system ATP-binding protein
MDGNEIALSIEKMGKTFPKEGGEMVALEETDLQVKNGEFVCILGPSGCGKTTLLRIIAGLQRPTTGRITIKGKEITGPGSDRGMVFQEFGLLPWRTVRSNVEFGLELKGVGRSERTKVSTRLIEMVGLTGFEEAHPNELSGGMKQRVGIARALATDPAILLMDEPFGALDAQTRNLMQKELLRIWKETKKTVIFVTHSVDEAVFLADRIIVLSGRPGHIKDIYDIPLEKPMDRASPDFANLRKCILNELEQEVIGTPKK